jgi:tetratricopeptide (TPR) repeat protein
MSAVLLIPLKNTCNALGELLQHKDTLIFSEWLIAVQIATNGPDSVASEIGKIAAMYSSQPKFDGARKAFVDYRNQRLAQYGVVDVDISKTYADLATKAETEGNLDEAVRYLDRSLNLRLAAQNTLDAAQTLTQYACVFIKQGRLDDATRLIELCLDICQRVDFGPTHAVRAINLLLGAKTYHQLGGHDDRALELFLQYLHVVAIADPSSRDEHVELHETVIQIKQDLGRFSDTVSHIERVHFVKTGQIIRLSDTAALLTHLKTKAVNTLGHHQHILHLQTLVLGVTHVESLASRVRIGQMLEKSGRLGDAVKYLNESILLGDTLLKPIFEQQYRRVVQLL